MTVNQLIAALLEVPENLRDSELEIEADIQYPSGEEGAEDWIVCPTIDSVQVRGQVEPGYRQYVVLEIS